MEQLDPLQPAERYPDREMPLDVARPLRSLDDTKTRCWVTVAQDHLTSEFVVELSDVHRNTTNHQLILDDDISVRTVMEAVEQYLDAQQIDVLT
jgi:hypothetical protein